jgi:3',5'-cyclic AMP phosphodiesterase CpdA
MTRLLHLSDPHFGASDPAVAEAFLAHAAGMKPDITLVSGDLTMRARRSELDAARDFVNRLPSPRLVIPGNHDIPLINQPFDRFFHPFGRYQETFGEELEPELVDGNVRIISLNSSRAFGFHADWSEGRLSKRQLASIRRRLPEPEPGGLRVLMLHHPLLELNIPGREVVKPLAGLLRAIEDARVDVVLCGHFHRSQIHAAGLTDSWRAVISQAPTVCSTRLQGEPQGFHEIRHDGDRLEAAHHIYQDGGFVEAGVSVFSRNGTGWNHATS